MRTSLKQRKAALASRMGEMTGADPLLEGVEDLDEAFAPDMLAEARAQVSNKQLVRKGLDSRLFAESQGHRQCDHWSGQRAQLCIC